MKATIGASAATYQGNGARRASTPRGIVPLAQRPALVFAVGAMAGALITYALAWLAVAA